MAISFSSQNASNEQCSMCGLAMETHTVHNPVGHSLISLVQQVKLEHPGLLHLVKYFKGESVRAYGWKFRIQRY